MWNPLYNLLNHLCAFNKSTSRIWPPFRSCGLLLKYIFPSSLYYPSHGLAVVDYQVSAELSTFMDPVPVFAFPSARGIKCIFGSVGQERAKFVHVSADFIRLFSETRASKLPCSQSHWSRQVIIVQELTSLLGFSPLCSAGESTWRTWNKEGTHAAGRQLVFSKHTLHVTSNQTWTQDGFVEWRKLIWLDEFI